MSDIAINPVTRRVQFTGNTGTGPFAFTFNILTSSDIAVYKGSTLLTLTANYSVNINANGTGSVTLTSALVATDVLTIIGGRQLARTTDFVTAGDLLASSLNEQLDSNVIMTQQLDEKFDRALSVGPGDTFTSLSLPLKDARKGTVLGFNATTGDPEAGPNISSVQSLADVSADIKTLADIQDGTVATNAITNVNTIRANVTTVSGISGNVTTVAGISGNVTSVAGNATNINTVAGISANVTTVAGQATEIGRLGTADAVADMNTLGTADIVSDMNLLGTSANVSNMDALGPIAGNISTVAGISSNVTTVAGQTTNLQNVTDNLSAIQSSPANAAAAATSATAAANSATAGATSATAAATSATASAGSATTATTQAGISTTKAAEAATSATAAETAKTAAEAALDEFTDIYLGAKSSDPTTDNDGNALTAGDQYFNTTTNALKIYNGSAWQVAALDSSGFVEITGDTMTGNLSITTGDNAAQLTLISTDADANDGPLLVLNRNSSSPSDNDKVGQIQFLGEDDASNSTIFGSIVNQIKDASNGSEDGRMSFNLISAGSDRTFLNLTHNGTQAEVVINEDSRDMDFRVESDNSANALLVEGSSGNVGIGTSSPTAILDVRRGDESGKIAEFHTSTGFGIELGSSQSEAYVQAGSSQALLFNTNVSNERMRITSAGNVGVGTSSPTSNYGTNLNVHSSATNGSALHLTDGTTGNANTDGFHLISTGGVAYVWNREATATVFATSNTERMRIDSGGNVGINTSSPSVPLTVESNSGGNSIRLLGRSSDGFAFLGFRNNADNANNAQIGVSNGAEMLFYTNGSNERMRIDSSGNVGIGTSSPRSDANIATLEVSGSTFARQILQATGSGGREYALLSGTSGSFSIYDYTASATRITIDSSGNIIFGSTGSTSAPSMYFAPDSGGGSFVKTTNSTSGRNAFSFNNPNGLVGFIETSGSSTSYSTSSDYRLKTDVQPMVGASERVQALNPVNFEWIADGTRVDGFLAHEAQAVVPEAVTGTKDAMRDEEYEVTPAVLDDDGNVTTEAVMGTRSVIDSQGIDQSKLVPLLTAALQEALTKIDSLETRLTALEGA